MKKILTIMLSVLMLFSSCLMISADDDFIIQNHVNYGTIEVTYEDDGNVKVQVVPDKGHTYPRYASCYPELDSFNYDKTTGVMSFNKGDLTEINLFANCPGKSIEGLSLNVHQDENTKALVIEASGDKTEDFLNYLVNTPGNVINSYCGAYEGMIMNWNDNNAIVKGDGKVTISKEALVKGGYVDGDYTFVFGGSYSDLAVNVTLDLGVEAPKSTQADTLKVSGYISIPVEGQSTSISNDALTVTDQDDNTIPDYDSDSMVGYELSWCEAITNDAGYTNYVTTSDKTFIADKDYYLMITYGYVMKNGDTPSIEVTDSNLKLSSVENFFGIAGGTFLQKTASKCYVMKYTAGRVKVSNTLYNGSAPQGITLADSSSKLKNAINLTDEEKAALDRGNNINVQLIVGDQSAVIKKNKEDVTKVDNKIKELGLSTTRFIYDLVLEKQVEGDNSEPKAIPETKGNVNITFPLDKNLINNDNTVNREYYVIRVHDGKAETINATYDSKTKAITFATDKFSTYAIAYKDSKKEEKKEESNTSSNASSTKVVTCEEAMGSKNWTWSESKKACVYKVSNTSSK